VGRCPQLVFRTCRGNAKEKVLLVDPDRELFLDMLGDVHGRFNCRWHACCQNFQANAGRWVRCCIECQASFRVEEQNGSPVL
jgi:hypothetical protein